MKYDVKPGDIWTANVYNTKQNAEATGKTRPVVVVRILSDNRVLVAGLTTLSKFEDGRARTRNPQPLSTSDASYLWGGNLIPLPPSQLRRFVAKATDGLVHAVASEHKLNRAERDAMLDRPSWAAPLRDLVTQ